MNTPKTIEFNSKTYTQAAIAKMSMVDLLALRNLVASNLGVSAVRSFKDQATAESATWAALTKFDDTDTGEAPAEKPKAVKKEPAVYSMPSKAAPSDIKRPTRSMFSVIKKLIKTAERGGHRWDNYKDGMTIADIIEGNDMCRADIMFYVDNQMMELLEATDAEFANRKAAWYKKHDKVDPDIAKAEAAAARAKAAEERKVQAGIDKAAKEKAAAEKKAAREADAADKKAAKEKAATAKKAAADKAAADKAAAK